MPRVKNSKSPTTPESPDKTNPWAALIIRDRTALAPHPAEAHGIY